MRNENEYRKLLKRLLKEGFKFVFFQEFNPEDKKQIILRHDVDFSTEYAFRMAKIEAELGIKASYFFLTHSHYNWHTIDFTAFKNLGHYTGLHIDFECELTVQEEALNNIYSIHRPDPEHLNTDKPFSTYNKKFFTDINYLSDSGNKELKKIKGNTQLLIHPIWWMTRGGTLKNKLNQWKKLQSKKAEGYILDNIKEELLR